MTCVQHVRIHIIILHMPFHMIISSGGRGIQPPPDYVCMYVCMCVYVYIYIYDAEEYGRRSCPSWRRRTRRCWSCRPGLGPAAARHVRVCVCMYIYIYIYICIDIYIYIYIHIHICKHTYTLCIYIYMHK